MMRVRGFTKVRGVKAKQWGVTYDGQWISPMFKTETKAEGYMLGYMDGVAYARGLHEAFERMTKERTT